MLERRRLKKEQEKENKLKEELLKQEKQRQKATKIDLELTAEQAIQNRMRKSKEANSSEAKAKKIMERMGWRGSGLGKDEQGIVAPLIAKKHNSSSGKIVQSELTYDRLNPSEEAGFPKRSVTFNREPTRVVLLMNTAEPEEANEGLGREIGQECLKFGKVEQVEVRVV